MARTNRGSRWTSELTTSQDPVSGATVRQYTNYKAHSHHFYFTNPGWYDGGRKVLFGSDYPFTTLAPNVGVVKAGERSFVVADVPGLIEGASEGKGLGHEFLRHIQRTRALVHLLDGLSEDPVADYSQINSELALFDHLRVDVRPQIASDRIDCLIFLFNADRKGRFHSSALSPKGSK